MEYYLNYKKCIKKYLFCKENIQTGGNGLQTAWIWFTMDETTRDKIYKFATETLQNTGLKIKSPDHLHISLITINMHPNDHNSLQEIVLGTINRFVVNLQNSIIIESENKLKLLPTHDPIFVTVTFNEYETYLSQLKFELRKDIINYISKKYGNIYAVKTNRDEKYRNHEALNFDAIRYFNRHNVEILNFRLDEYDNTYHVSITNRSDTLQSISNVIQLDKQQFEFNNVNKNMFEYKIKQEVSSEKHFFFIHNIKLKPKGKMDPGTHALCNKDKDKDKDKVINFVKRTYGFALKNIKITCGGKDKNLLQLYIFQDSKTIDLDKGQNLVVQSRLNKDSQEWIYFKIVRDN